MKFFWIGLVALASVSASAFAEEGAQVLTYRERNLVVTWKPIRFSSGSSYDRDDRFPGGTNNRGGVPYESGGWTPGNDLNPPFPPIHPTPSSTPSATPSSLPSQTSSSQTPDELEVFIEYAPNDRFSVGVVKYNSARMGIEVPLALYRQLSTARPHSVAQLVVQSTTDNTSNGRHVISKIFIGGAEDLDCKVPVLISDLNGTLDRGDDCTRNTLNSLMRETGLTVFVVSTLGASAANGVKAQRFEHSDRFLVLGDKASSSSLGSSSGSSFSSGSYGSSAGMDKAQRLKDHLWASGACIIGFSGETPSIEGAAAIKSGIPYLAVHQHDRTIMREERRSKAVCVEDIQERPQLTRLKKNGECPEDYDRWEAWETVCLNEAGEERGYILGAAANFYNPPSKRMAEAKCEQFKLLYKEHKKTTFCKLWAPVTRPREVEPLESGACPEGFKLQSVDVLVRVPAGSEPSINISEYPKDSFYARDWCEMKPHLEELIRKLRTP